ncbi:hypothetical protein NQ314_019972 [Rhamnusium bicolor]|uniref:acid phosphatase n=1 Tax=Rhamnusium bicolor TaxID=1586634 RepID=A0AAV8WLY7_9CUCU|nr:hypothetical protein NQ314_019972 [Rhamnusium bicolor]
MSAYAALAGLYPPKNSQIWNQNLLWQPIPVHTRASEEDEVLTMRKYCNKYEKLYQNTLDSKYFKKIRATYEDFFEYVSKHSGWNLTDFNEIRTLQTVLDIYNSSNASFIPPWTKTLNNNILIYLAGLAHQRYTFTTELKRLLTGPFWANLVTYFDHVVDNSTNTPRFLMLSAHDTTIVSLLNCMGVYDLLPPDFADTLIWELRKSTSGKYYINLFYKKTNLKPKILTIKNCETDCEFDHFKRILDPITVDSVTWEEECASAGKTFASLKELEDFIEIVENELFISLFKRDSKSLEYMKKYGPKKKFEMPIKIWYFIESYILVIEAANNLRLEENENLGE